MNLEDAIAAHAEWKMKLRRAIQHKERLDVAGLSVDNKCPLGQWLHGEAKVRYSELEAYRACVAKHAEFHRCAGLVASAINAGNYTDAEGMLANGTPYADASIAATVAIMGLRKQAGI